MRTLSLQCLPQLTSFGFKESTAYAGSEEIFAEDKLGGFVPSFSQNLKGLPNLTQFGSGNSVEFHSLIQLSIEDCPKLKTFSHALASADIKQSNEIEQMNCQYDIHPLFGETVTLIYFEVQLINRNSLFYFEGKSLELPSLAELWLENCPKMQAFVSNSPDADIPTNKEEQVNSEQSLRANIQPLFDEKILIPSLKLLLIKKMKTRNIWYQDQLTLDSFSKIDSFEVYDCHNLLNIFPSNMLGRLQKLEELVIQRCNSLEEIFEELKISPCMMEDIVAKEDLEAVPRFVFPQFKLLQLVDLPSLISFYSGVYISEWPKLKKLRTWGCNKVEMLTSEFLSLQKSHGESQLENSIQEPLFIVDKVGFRGIENFTVSDFPDLKEVWHNQLLITNLKSLVVDDKCSSLKYLFTQSLALGLVQLQELEIKNCAVLEAIIVIDEERTDNTLFPNLTRLELKDLPKLLRFCNFLGNSIELPSLARLWIDNCPNMETFISGSTDANMPASKENLHIDIQPFFNEKEIFAKEEEVNEVVPRFPRLTLLRLAKLLRLQSFYPMVHISEWPMLKKLQIWNCDRIEISASKILSFQLTDGESQHDMSMGQPLLLLDKVPLTNLESLGLDWKWVEKEALHEKLPEYSCKLKLLTFSGFRKGADICVFCLPKKLPNLDKLQVIEGFFKEVFLSEGLGCEEEHVETANKLSSLRLFNITVRVPKEIEIFLSDPNRDKANILQFVNIAVHFPPPFEESILFSLGVAQLLFHHLKRVVMT
ncbi:hypothetical protein QYF36_000692 [Acer negundo]|nr:hypothetical protein QYF36_000692 [Acer negundo]